MTQNQPADVTSQNKQLASKQAGAGRLIKHSSIYAAGNILRQLVGFIMLPVYTRYLSPADYGVVGLLIFAVSLIELVFGARLVQAVPKFFYEQKQPAERHAVISTALLITSAVSAATMLVVILLREPSSQGIFGTPDYGLIVGLFAVLILTHAIENYALVFIRIQQKPWLFISVNLGKLTVQLSLNIWLVVFQDLGVMGVAISSAAASLVFAVLLATYTLAHTGIRFRAAQAKKMLIFCWPLWLAGLAGLYIGSANRYYIRIFSSLDDVGLYELAAKFGSILTLLIWQPFAQYWQTERFDYYQQGNAEPIFQAVFRFISTLLILAALGISLFADLIIRLMAAPEFHQASRAVPFLVFGALFSSLIAFSNFSFLITERTGWIGRNNYLTAAVVTVLYLAMIPWLGFVGAAAALMLAQGLQFLIVHRTGRQYYDMQISLVPLGLNLGIAGLGCLVASLLASDNLIRDIAAKSFIAGLCSIAIVAGLLRDPGTKARVLAMLPAHFPGRRWLLKSS